MILFNRDEEARRLKLQRLASLVADAHPLRVVFAPWAGPVLIGNTDDDLTALEVVLESLLPPSHALRWKLMCSDEFGDGDH